MYVCAAIVVSTAATNNDSGVFKGSNDCPSLTKSLHDDTNQQQNIEHTSVNDIVFTIR